MRIIAFFSGGASALVYLAKHDPNFGKKYKVVCAFTDKKHAEGILFVNESGLPLECLDAPDYFPAHNLKPGTPEARTQYFREASAIIKPFNADLLILCGFMRIVTEPLLSEYPNRILNVHPADLTVLDESGRRKYVGADPVTLALAAGEKSTRSTVHLVTAEVDGGPIVTVSNPLEVEPGIGPKTHQAKMKWACDGPAYAKALEMIADGAISLDNLAKNP
ncbi:MAG: hypothetical protein HY093_01315 [Candidatus Liptonbacteria bacterium]|nr:hypothetical protein [Candidatus Liptonbacteria bacterium]